MKRLDPSECYAPAESLIKVLSDINNFEVRRARFEAKISAGGDKNKKNKKQQETLDEEKKALKKEKRLLDRRKVDALNKHVFPSMANLTKFLELMLVSPHLHRVFERDLKALFFAKSKVSENKDTIFGRFIEAAGPSLISKQKDDGTQQTALLPDFRFILWEIMIQKIWKSTPSIGEYKFKDPTFLHNVLYQDFGRAVSWLNLLAHEAHGHLEFDEKRRPALF